MKAARVAFVALIACNDSGGAMFDASAAEAGVDADPAVCTVSVAQYCDAQPCPADEDAALAQLCAQWGVVSTCGGAIDGFAIDIGSGYVFDDDGGLAAVFTFANTKARCLAGSPGTNVSGFGCTFTTNACGDASDQ